MRGCQVHDYSSLGNIALIRRRLHTKEQPDMIGKLRGLGLKASSGEERKSNFISPVDHGADTLLLLTPATFSDKVEKRRADALPLPVLDDSQRELYSSTGHAVYHDQPQTVTVLPGYPGFAAWELLLIPLSQPAEIDEGLVGKGLCQLLSILANRSNLHAYAPRSLPGAGRPASQSPRDEIIADGEQP